MAALQVSEPIIMKSDYLLNLHMLNLKRCWKKVETVAGLIEDVEDVMKA